MWYRWPSTSAKGGDKATRVPTNRKIEGAGARANVGRDAAGVGHHSQSVGGGCDIQRAAKVKVHGHQVLASFLVKPEVRALPWLIQERDPAAGIRAKVPEVGSGDARHPKKTCNQSQQFHESPNPDRRNNGAKRLNPKILADCRQLSRSGCVI